VLALRRAALDDLDADADLSLTDNVYPRLIEARTLGAEVVADDFHDIGTPDGYARFCRYAETDADAALLFGAAQGTDETA
jgi:NDP-sugar pyrophosphorylase family protein